MNAKVVSDGTPFGTKIILASGAELKGVVSARWGIQGVDQLAELEVDIVQVESEAAGRLSVWGVHPIDGDLRDIAKIVFADGSEWSAL